MTHTGKLQRTLLLFILSGALLFESGVTWAVNDRSAKEVETQKKLEVIREEIAALTHSRNSIDTERNDATRQLREADQAVDLVARALRETETHIAEQETRLAELEVERDALNKTLSRQREALASLLRSAYALGRHEQLKLLLAQDRIDELARVMAYHRYFQRDRISRIDTLLNELESLAFIVKQVQAQREALASSHLEQQQRIATLEQQREERRQLVAELDGKFKDTTSKLQALGRDEQALGLLLEQLQDIFADIPDRLEQTQSFAQRQGRLSPPATGKTITTFGGSMPDGRQSQGLLIGADHGTPVKAIAHGRIAFSDWLKGYGLLVIIDHGDGYMSLYAHNDSLHRDTGAWVKPGDTIASVGSSGGQTKPALYFELRRYGRPFNPKGWLSNR